MYGILFDMSMLQATSLVFCLIWLDLLHQGTDLFCCNLMKIHTCAYYRWADEK